MELRLGPDSSWTGSDLKLELSLRSEFMLEGREELDLSLVGEYQLSDALGDLSRGRGGGKRFFASRGNGGGTQPFAPDSGGNKSFVSRGKSGGPHPFVSDGSDEGRPLDLSVPPDQEGKPLCAGSILSGVEKSLLEFRVLRVGGWEVAFFVPSEATPPSKPK